MNNLNSQVKWHDLAELNTDPLEQFEDEDALLAHNIILAYHGPGCVDGQMAKLLMERVLIEFTIARSKGSANIIHAPMQYDVECYETLIDYCNIKDDPEYEAESNPKLLVVVDFSLPIDILMRIAKDTDIEQICIIDHHQTAFTEYLGEDYEVTPTSKIFRSYELPGATCELYLDMTKSGAGIVASIWKDWLSETLLDMTKYVEDYDLWKHNYSASKALHRYFLVLKDSDDSWQEAQEVWGRPRGKDFIIKAAEKLLKTFRQECTLAAEQGKLITCNDFLGRFVVIYKDCISEAGNIAASKQNSFALLTDVKDWRWKEDMKEVSWSIRVAKNFEHINAGELCRDIREITGLSGGGHAKAAGFTLSYDDSLSLYYEIINHYATGQTVNLYEWIKENCRAK